MDRSRDASVLITAGLLLCVAAGPVTKPVTRPASQPVESPAATALLSSVREAYLATTSLKVEGTIKGEFDVAGRKQDYANTFDGVTDNAGRYGGRVTGASQQAIQQFAADGKQLTLYDAKRNTFATVPAQAKRVASSKHPESFVALMLDGDASSLLMLSDDPDQLLRRGATKLDAPGTPAGQPAVLEWESGDETRKFFFDPDTRLLKRIEINYAPLFAARKTDGMKRAFVVVDYSSVRVNEPVAEKDFDFKPPNTASEFVLPSELMEQEATTQPAS